MGGTPRRKDKPRPSYEDGELRDPEIEAKVDLSVGEAALFRLIKRATVKH